MAFGGVVLLAHGSGRGRCTADGLKDIAARLARRLAGRAEVRLAFFEFLRPNLDDALADLAAAGLTRVVVLPYFLFDGKEVKVEIPALLAESGARFPTLQLVQAPNLGIDRRLIDVVAERVDGALAGLGQLLPIGGRLPVRGETGRVGVVLVNRGSRARYDDGSRLRELCALLSRRLGGTPVEPAQAERSAELTIANAVDRLIALGCERIVTAPYLHFPGKVLNVNVVPAVERAAAAHPERRFYLAATLGVDDRLVDLCVDRLAETLTPGPRGETSHPGTS